MVIIGNVFVFYLGNCSIFFYVVCYVDECIDIGSNIGGNCYWIFFEGFIKEKDL